MRGEDALREFRHPEAEKDQAVAKNQLKEIASGTAGGAVGHRFGHRIGHRIGHQESMACGTSRSRDMGTPRLGSDSPRDCRHIRLPELSSYTSSSGMASSKVRV